MTVQIAEATFDVFSNKTMVINAHLIFTSAQWTLQNYKNCNIKKLRVAL